MKKRKKNKSIKMPTDAELLAELSTLDEVTVWSASGMDHDHAVVPTWCEIVLEIRRVDDGSLNPAWPLNIRAPLRRHDGEQIAQVLHDVLHPARATQSGDAIWAALDEVVERIQRRVERGKEPLKVDVGQARGLSTAIALMDNPLEPDLDEVRAVAMERYTIRHDLGE